MEVKPCHVPHMLSSQSRYKNVHRWPHQTIPRRRLVVSTFKDQIKVQHILKININLLQNIHLEPVSQIKVVYRNVKQATNLYKVKLYFDQCLLNLKTKLISFLYIWINFTCLAMTLRYTFHMTYSYIASKTTNTNLFGTCTCLMDGLMVLY